MISPRDQPTHRPTSYDSLCPPRLHFSFGNGNDRGERGLRDAKWKVGMSVKTTATRTGPEDPRPVLDSGEGSFYTCRTLSGCVKDTTS